jgi:Fe2+ transport system protein FeoA
MTLADIKNTSNTKFEVVETCTNHMLLEFGIVPGALLLVIARVSGNIIVDIIGSGRIAMDEITAECIVLNLI